MYRSVRRLTAFVLLAVILTAPGAVRAQTPVASTPDLELTDVSVEYRPDLGILVFSQTVEGTAGATTPEPAGQMDGAPVLAYVFPTTLDPKAVGFLDVEGTLAFVVTSHPDFDDTPLWDENQDGDPHNDGLTYHTHWVVLGEDDRVPGGLSVVETNSNGEADLLPPTAPGMPMYLDSPGFSVWLEDDTLSVVVPIDRVQNNTEFNYDGVTAYLEVNESDPDRPLLGVYEVYGVLSGDLSLPYEVEHVEGN